MALASWLNARGSGFGNAKRRSWGGALAPHHPQCGFVGIRRVFVNSWQVKHPRSPNPEMSSKLETLKTEFFTAKANDASVSIVGQSKFVRLSRTRPSQNHAPMAGKCGVIDRASMAASFIEQSHAKHSTVKLYGLRI